MPTITQGSGSSATTIPSAGLSFKLLTKRASTPQLAENVANPNQPLSSLAPSSISRKIKSKTDRKDKADSRNQGHPDTAVIPLPRTSVLRRLSPGLAARVKLLDGSTKPTTQLSHRRDAVGRIPEDQIRGLETLRQDLSVKLERRGRAWSGALKGEKSAPSLPHSQLIEHTGTGSQSFGVSARETKADRDTVPEHIKVLASNAVPVMTAIQSTLAPKAMTSQSNGIDSTLKSTDLEEYLKRSVGDDENPPPPPPKDTPPMSAASTNAQSYFNPLGLQRTESIYSFSRASFSNQLSQLTSINLPHPTSLEASINSIATAPAAVKALIGAAEQIQKWINKASEVLGRLDAEDDVEWAAAGGREGLDDVDKAVTRFESLVNIYVKAIEDVQLRGDIECVEAQDLKIIVSQMEMTLKNWGKVRSQLKGVKEQVELAMEWEELWSVVLGDVGLEIDNLSRLIFEMEENRHKSLADPDLELTSGLDINELGTIVEESPPHNRSESIKRFGVTPVFTASLSLDPSALQNPKDDSNLVQLFARMQPLRASLDFLPMRLSMFQSRAEKIFPSACEELEDRRKRLEKSYKKLEADAEALRKELGEDRWILVFRNAGRQAQKMCESVERSVSKLQESLEAGDSLSNQAAVIKKAESYETKKIHYVPAVDRVMSIIQKGINDRLTVNGEILRLLSDMKSRVDALKTSMKVMDSLLVESHVGRSQQLRDSVSTIVTMDSPATGSTIETPGSSPASSVIMSSGIIRGVSTPNVGGSSRRGSSVGSTTRSTSNVRHYSGLTQTASSLTRKSSIPRASLSGSITSPTSCRSNLSATPTPASRASSRPPSSPLLDKPRWNGSSNTNDLDVGHNFKPLSVTTPSPYRKTSLPIRASRATSTNSSLAVPSPLSRTTSTSPDARAVSRTRGRLASPVSHRASPSASPASTLLSPLYSKLQKQSSTVGLLALPRTRQSYAGMPATKIVQDINAGLETKANRPGTSLSHSSRRSSLLPQPKHRSGRDNSPNTSNRFDERPPWR